MTHSLLEQGIGAAQAGRRANARTLLMQVIETDERNEQAWLWLAGVMDDPEGIRTCLENVLQLNPANDRAQQGLSWIEQRYGARPTTAAEPAAPQPEPVSAAVTATTEDQPASPAQPLAPTPTAPPIAQPTPDYPCPYCGAAAALTDRSCRQCHNDLMIRVAPREKRSVPLTILGILWILSGVLELLGGLAATILAAIAFSTLQSQLQRAHRASVSFPPQLFIPAGTGLFVGFVAFAIGRGLLRRARWAYIVVLVLTALGLLLSVGSIVLGAVSAAALMKLLSDPALSPRAAESTVITATSLFAGFAISLGVQALYALLVGLSYRDFFGPVVRFQPELETGDDVAHYNSGVVYKNRGMWYMAAQEWNAANKLRPRDSSYLHALGLAYGQLKQFDAARATLDLALQVAPADPHIQESRALVDRLDKPHKKR